MKKIGILPNLLVHPHGMPSNRGIRMLLVIILVFLQVVVVKSAPPTEIVMRFIDGNSGKPLTGVQIQLDAWAVDEFNPKSEKIIKTWNGKTDKNGRVLIRLQVPLPQHLSFRSPDELHECSGERFSVEDALRSGILAKYSEKCGKLKAVATATPGEIVVFDRKYKFLD
jgi:hypothetical protein